MTHDFGSTVFILLLIGLLVWKAISRWEKQRKETELKENNPEVWLRMKQMEHDKRKMGVQVGTTIATFLMRMFQR